MNSSNLLENLDTCDQVELFVNPDNLPEPKKSTVYDLLILQGEKADRQQQHLEELSQGLLEVLVILSNNSEYDSISMQALEAIKQEVATLNQGVTSLGQGVWKIYQHLEKDSIGKELKSGQQNLQKAIEANTQKKNTANIGYLDWKQIASIITATAIVSSLCSLAVFQIAANWKTDRTPTPTEKPLKPKKTTK